ncbi:adenosylcobinamide-phosphate synthase CbiB [Roseicitreum antarcticum]|uniref:Cobalamin biosynthesis protein CobD n=1 Tax=Roseicitreum antarcticum TaxID=564137 RepID=A0A1H3BJG5_9RHOB|nr:adenosylcobinamide-phosphate synthase CbiB [Roseicitreum antarcticum]SDX41891.1 adenosylcobinamide-phosphate synthase [Roseicitreum antarcticum]
MALTLVLTLIAMTAERAFGYPDRLFRAIGHPVTWLGALIGALDRRWNIAAAPASTRRRRGVYLVLVLLATAVIPGAVLHVAGASGWAALIGVAVLTSSLIAQKSLADHVVKVAEGLERGLEDGRAAVSMIVGRDPDRLDEAGVARAAIESLAENFSDGVTAPVFWLALAGPAGGLGYKAINTADSMVGHLTDRHRDFGRAAAKLDDLINLPASRLTGAAIILAAFVSPGMSGRGAARAIRRDARHHKSPNAGWPEAAMAGALGISLAGPRYYHGVLIEDGEMNAGGRRALGAADIRCALQLYWRADAVIFVTLALVLAGVLLV